MLSDLHYPCGEPPLHGLTREIVPGVLWLRMPMPYALDHINLWALRDDDGWAIVDSGLQTEATEQAWRMLLAFNGPLSDGITRVIATHMHPDHIGMAGWLVRRAGISLWMTREEYLTGRLFVERQAPAPDPVAVHFYDRAGIDAAVSHKLAARLNGYGRYVDKLPGSYQRIRDGDRIVIGGYMWHVIVGAGHSPEHACLYCPEKQLLISGDQVLPRISSNVSVYPLEPEADPIADWLCSLQKLDQLVPDETLVLPAHNEPFVPLHVRLDQLVHSQNAALERLRCALSRPQRAIDILPTLFPRLIPGDLGQLSLAIGEGIAHLNHLSCRGEAVREIGADGIAWYRRS